MICCGTSNRLSLSKLFHAQLLNALYDKLLLVIVAQRLVRPSDSLKLDS